MSLFVDTCVWSLAFRRDSAGDLAEVHALRRALEGQDSVVSSGIILQELLQGFTGPKAGGALIERFAALPFVSPDRQDHVDAAALHNRCRRSGIQLGTIDALIAQLCIRNELTLLTTDQDFTRAAKFCSLRLWKV